MGFNVGKMRSGMEMAGLASKVAADIKGLREGLDQIRLTHFESRVGSQSFLQAGTASVAPLGSAILIDILPTAGRAWVLKEFGNVAGADQWDVPEVTELGIYFQILRGKSPIEHLDHINFSLGSVAQRGALHVAGNAQERIQVIARNTHATATIEACCSLVGVSYSGEEGGA